MATRFTGGCICGGVRYECAADPIAMGNCHCRDCQRASGSAYAPALLVPASAVSITGEVKYYDVTGDSGSIVQHGFCTDLWCPFVWQAGHRGRYHGHHGREPGRPELVSAPSGYLHSERATVGPHESRAPEIPQAAAKLGSRRRGRVDR